MHLPWRDVAAGDGPAISTSITPEEATALAGLAASAGDVLEIGSAFGYSAIVMALAGARVAAVDPHTWVPDSLAGMERNLAAYGVTGVAILVESSLSAMSMFAAEGSRFGLVFIDGDHSEAAVERDVRAALPLLAPGGALACHDLGEDCCCPGVRAALTRLFPDGPDELVGTLAVYKAPLSPAG